MKNNVNYYERLEDYPEPDVLKEEIKSLLSQSSDEQAEPYLEALYELSLRKENIELDLDEVTLQRIDKVVRSLWNSNSLSNTEFVIMIIFNFELKQAFQMLKDKYSQVASYEVKQELEQCFDDAKHSPPPIKNW